MHEALDFMGVCNQNLSVFLQWVFEDTPAHNGDEGNMTVKVESCSNYTFAVRCALDKAPWSDWSWQETVLTNLNSKINSQNCCQNKQYQAAKLLMHK